MSETDTDQDRWAIRNIARTDRDAAVAAAARARLGVGEWLGRAIRAYIAAERDPTALMGQVLEHEPQPQPPNGAVPSIEAIGRAVEIAKSIADMSGQKPAQNVLAAAKRGLMHHLGADHGERKRLAAPAS